MLTEKADLPLACNSSSSSFYMLLFLCRTATSFPSMSRSAHKKFIFHFPCSSFPRCREAQWKKHENVPTSFSLLLVVVVVAVDIIVIVVGVLVQVFGCLQVFHAENSVFYNAAAFYWTTLTCSTPWHVICYITCWKVFGAFSFFCSASTRSLHSFVSPSLFSLSLLRSPFNLHLFDCCCLQWWKNPFHFHLFFHFLSLIYLIPPRFLCSRVTNESRVKKRLCTARKMKNVEYTLYSLQSILGLADEMTCSLLGASVENPFSIYHHQVVNHELFHVCNARACCRVVNIAVVRPW